MIDIVEFLDFLCLFLIGECLIEVFVGIGKIFIIVVLYLWLLLGLGGEVVYFCVISVEELLVVIFIEVVIEELCGCICSNIYELCIVCLCGEFDNLFYSVLLVEIVDKDDVVKMLLLVEWQMDEVVVFIIYGFC